MIGSFVSTLVALAFLGLGAGAALAPADASRGYGVPAAASSEFAYVRAVGARDAVLGLLVFWFLVTGARGPLRATLAVSALVGASDFAIVLGTRGVAARGNLLVHAGGTLGLLAASRFVRPAR